MTPAQERMLEEIRAAGSKTFNGRAAAPLKALREAGLIWLDEEWTFDAAKGHLRCRYTATAR